MRKIMIVEDDPAIREELALLLENEGYQALAVTDFGDVPGQAGTFGPDLVLLDLGLPGRDGFSLCAELRRRCPVPIVVVTSRNSAADELRALSLGGDDYITKPYSIPILLARIKAVLRRSGGPSEPDILEAGGVRLSLSRGTVWASGRTAELTRNELKILAHLMAHAGEIVSRADLIEALWDSRIYIDDNTLSVNVTRLRNKLGELGLPEQIKTRRGMGYQYDDRRFSVRPAGADCAPGGVRGGLRPLPAGHRDTARRGGSAPDGADPGLCAGAALGVRPAPPPLGGAKGHYGGAGPEAAVC